MMINNRTINPLFARSVRDFVNDDVPMTALYKRVIRFGTVVWRKARTCGVHPTALYSSWSTDSRLTASLRNEWGPVKAQEALSDVLTEALVSLKEQLLQIVVCKGRSSVQAYVKILYPRVGANTKSTPDSPENRNSTVVRTNQSLLFGGLLLGPPSEKERWGLPWMRRRLKIL